jgi:integrase
MSVYKRGGIYWYEFEFAGSRIRESAKTNSRRIAQEAERKRRSDLERAVNGLVKRERPPLLPAAVRQWLNSRAGLAPHTLENYRLYANRAIEHFGQRVICDIGESDIAELVRKRQRQGFKPRRINFELAVLRMVLRHFGVWDSLKGRTRLLREPRDVGRAISQEDEEKILIAMGGSRTPVLLPLFVISIDTGLRASELRHLRHRDLTPTWSSGAVESAWLTVSHSKTEGGSGRTIPLTPRACSVLTLWLSRFPDAAPDAYVFPRHRIGFIGNGCQSDLYGIDPSKPIGSWKKAWRHALSKAGLHYRWHDARHTFISRLAESPAVSEQTIMSLAGHISKSMLARYSHIRKNAKLAAIAALQNANVERSPQKSPQSDGNASERHFDTTEKSLNCKEI